MLRTMLRNYNINWDELNFSQDELNVFDNYMSDVGWMGLHSIKEIGYRA